VCSVIIFVALRTLSINWNLIFAYVLFPFLLLRQNAFMLELKSRVEEMKLESAYQQKLCEQSLRDQLKELTEKFDLELEEQKKIADVSLMSL